METVDVLLATYQSNIPYLKKQIDSILQQTHTNIRLKISDDCSKSEELRKVLEEYQQKDDRVTIYFQEKNLGYTQNFGFLLEKAEAEYICFSDHDDIWYPQKIEKSLEVLKKEHVDLVYCNCRQIDENDQVIHESYFQYKNVPLVNSKSRLAISRCVGIGCAQLFTKKVKDKMLPFKKTVMAHDWLASFIANQNQGMYYIQEPLFSYRLHRTNVFGGRSFNQNLERWKEKNGTSYQSYLQYRKQDVIDKAYLTGAQMCLDYAEDEKTKSVLEKLIQYYKNIERSRFVNFHWIVYFQFLAGKNLLKKMIKEFCIFHLPVLGYIVYKRGI